MRSPLFVSAILLCYFAASVSGFPRFFPNTSAIPPSLFPNATAAAWGAFQKFAGCHLGDKMDGLSKLKEYFHRFGYIPDNNFTDSFDEALQSALKTYQQNFNLNPTGQLDVSTLQQIVRPRCGVADIINGSSSMNSGKAPSASPDGHFHTVAHYSYFPGEPRWSPSDRALTYGFLPGNQLPENVKAVFARAFDRWSAVIPLTFSEAPAYGLADIRIGFYSGDHNDGEPFDGVLGTLAHAFSPPSGRFHLDLDENWVVSDEVGRSPTAIHLESVAVHEIGHLLGLGHSSVEDAIMFPTITSGMKKVELAADDIQGIQNLYGSNPNFNGSSTTSSSSGQDNGTPENGVGGVGPRWGTNLLLAVGFVLLLL